MNSNRQNRPTASRQDPNPGGQRPNTGQRQNAAPPSYADPRNFRAPQQNVPNTAGQYTAGQYTAGQNTAQQNPARQNSARQNPARQNTAQTRTQQNRNAQNARNADPRSRSAPQSQTRLSPEEIARRQEIARQKRERQEWMEQQRRIQEQRAQEIKAREKEIRRKEFRENVKILGARFLVLLFVVLILGLIFGGIAALVFFFHTPDAPEDSGKITYFYGGQEVRQTPLADALMGDDLSFCFNDLSDYLGMAESGTAQAMKFVLPQTALDPGSVETSAGEGTEESVTFTTDTRRVTVNGQDVQLKIPSVIRDTEIWVSSSFVDDYFLNLSFRYDEDRHEVYISQIKDEENSEDKKVVYLPVSLQLKNARPIASIEEDPLIGDVPYGTGEEGTIPLNFTTNLAAYEEYMNPTGEMRDAYLTLVNPTHTLTETDVPTDLADLAQTAVNKNTQQLRTVAAKALDALFQEMRAAGFYDMAVYSGYRTYSYQSILFDQYTDNEMAANPSLTREQAEEIVLTYSTRPGTSEHQTGLAVDMDNMGAFSTDFAFTAEYEWLQENAWKFGFILRFPQEKVSITGIQFEPWHYRFVGRYHAQKMHDSGLCLEEYVERMVK